MIKGLFETHIYVEDLARSIDFYSNTLGLTQCHYEEERKIAFFWIGKPQEAMLGIWEKPKDEIDIRHFAFRCDVDDVLNKAVQFLESKNLKPYNFLKSGNHEPMVLPGCPLWLFTLMIPMGMHWSLLPFWKKRLSQSWA
ncbi:VOC family protein [Pedobacter borealis]|uniref:VOC family protein n=1 Tax=Pedobacter borealis TaxID=475254 RepID=UPI000A477599|nr:VOC family protein [Pedobacter borealis]